MNESENSQKGGKMSFFIESNPGYKHHNYDKGEVQKITNNILEYFPKLGKYIFAIFFLDYPNSYEAMKLDFAYIFPMDYPNSSLNIKFFDVFQSIRNKNYIDFVFVFTKLITDGDKWTKTIFLSHEFQHAYQYIRNKQLYYFGRILDNFSDVMKIPKEMLPLEYDAMRESKYITTSLYDEGKITRFTKEKLDNNDSPKYLWAFLNSKDIPKDYNVENEVLKLWEEHGIQEKIDGLKKKRFQQIMKIR